MYCVTCSRNVCFLQCRYTYVITLQKTYSSRANNAMVSLNGVKTPKHVGDNRWYMYVRVFNVLCAFSWNKKKKLTAKMHGAESFKIK